MDINIPTISINPLTNFVGATDSQKIRIIKEQKKVDTFKANWYQTVKAELPKYVKKGFDYSILENAIKHLRSFDQSTEKRKTNVTNSILAIETFVNMNFTKHLPNVDYHFYDKLERKYCQIYGFNVLVSPDVVFSWIDEKDGKKNIGAIKFHFGKTKELDSLIGRLRSSLICYFLRKSVVQPNEFVNPKYCFCVDVFHCKTYSAPSIINPDILLLKDACEEINKLWTLS